jgi:DNA-binding HxlR family transcriptional regulator
MRRLDLVEGKDFRDDGFQSSGSEMRELERDGIVDRVVHREVPPRVEYSLTELGLTLQPILLLMCDWGKEYVGKGGKLQDTGIAAAQ